MTRPCPRGEASPLVMEPPRIAPCAPHGVPLGAHSRKRAPTRRQWSTSSVDRHGVPRHVRVPTW
ncbi:hypothetical protein BU14_0943s0004 [Porphyra umbilicalis]|uniref:Uncharacterized protein n=1 Tax=Porphyra umbilicalis TaxID=2786 RepID=A0A1X6NN71_PORUM|nr:hypothetical protein BU14_0943s0004 [Porphyra umbilicalis]|eukprot:OSX70035.1 hypothetical protein BU14_0943s0004 [Porphyra umbilicalis]